MCLMIASDGISQSERCQHEADYCDKIYDSQHPLSLLSLDSPKGFYLIGGSQSLRRGLTAYRVW